jgi:hypothetical protein
MSMDTVYEDRDKDIPYNSSLLTPSPWRFLLPFTKCPASGGESNYESESTLIHRNV